MLPLGESARHFAKGASHVEEEVSIGSETADSERLNGRWLSEMEGHRKEEEVETSVRLAGSDVYFCCV